jgi:hypothetical protein
MLMGTLFTSAGALNFNTKMTDEEVHTEVWGPGTEVPAATSIAKIVGVDDRNLPVTITFVRGHIQGLVIKEMPIVAITKPSIVP